MFQGRTPRLRTDQWQGSTRSKRLPKDWPQRRAKALERDPICTVCWTAPSTEVDHIRPGDDHSHQNLRGICNPCHKKKTAQEGAAARHRHKRQRPNGQHPGLTG